MSAEPPSTHDDDLEDLVDLMDTRYGAARGRPEPDSADVLDLNEKKNGPLDQGVHNFKPS